MAGVPEDMKMVAAALAIGLAGPTALLACSLAVIQHEIDPAECSVDRTAPAPPDIEVVEVVRGRGPAQRSDGLVSISSCDDIGRIALRFIETPRDDRTPREKLGFIVSIVDGDVPKGFEPSGQALRHPDDDFSIHWLDGATDEQEPLELAISIVVVDLAGNRSEPSEPVWVRHPGSS